MAMAGVESNKDSPLNVERTCYGFCDVVLLIG